MATFMKFFTARFLVYRNYSTKYGSEVLKWAQKNGGSYKNYSKRNAGRKIEWTSEQAEVLRHVPDSSIFLTGPAGTGKTELEKEAIKRMKKVYGKSRVAVTASTGIAACAIKGQTIHSFAGIGLGEGDCYALLSRVQANKRACYRWKSAKVLVIEEISMLDARLFETLEFIARKVRGSDEVWGGLKLMVSGDFFQLPPVSKKRDSSGKEFAFEADCWDSSFEYQFQLTKVQRQSDPMLLLILHSIRRGGISDEHVEFLLKSCSVEEPHPSAIRLYPRIDDVERVNNEKLKALSKKTTIYEAFDAGATKWRKQLVSGVAPDRLCLCVGARVMLIKNLNVWAGLVNGSTGTVVRFADGNVLPDINSDKLLPVVKFDSGKEIVIESQKWEVMEGGKTVASRQQIPLVLAWALSIHKCQGMTLDRIHTDLSRAFGWGMAYVALSRVTSLEGLQLSGFCPSKIMAHPKVVKFYERFDWEKELMRKLIDSASERESTQAE